MSDTYHWCQLANGDKRTAGYIEARGATVGSKVELTELDGEFWEVLTVGDAVSKEFMRAQGQRFKGFQESLKGGGIA